MANIDPAPSWANIRRLETTDRNMAGPAGILNDPTTSIAARLNLLRENDTALGNSVASVNARQDATDASIANIEGQVLNAPGTLSDLDHGAPISVVGNQFPDVLSIDNSRGPVIALNESISDLVQRDEWLRVNLDSTSFAVEALQSNLGSAAFKSASEFATAEQGSQISIIQSDLNAAEIRIDSIEAGQSTSSIYFDTKSQMDSAVGQFVGQGAFVANGVGSGQYRWDGAAWQFLRADSLSQKADASFVKSMVDNSVNYNDISSAIVFSDNSIALEIDSKGNQVTEIPRFSKWPAVAYGDSTTAGADLTTPAADRWTRILESMLGGKQVWNFGVSGERSDEIQFRYSAISIYATVPGGVIAASGSTVINFDSTDPLRASSSAQQVVITCEDGTKIIGRISSSGSNRTFTRSVPGAAVSTSKVSMTSTGGFKNRGQILFLSGGINDEVPIFTDGTRDSSFVKRMYMSAIKNMIADNPTYIVWGLLDRGLPEAPGTAIGDYLIEMDKWFGEQYGCNYCPVRNFLISSYSVTIAQRLQPGFTPTSADLDAINAKVTPLSYRVNSSSVHLNPLGHKLQAWYIYMHMLNRGIV